MNDQVSKFLQFPESAAALPRAVVPLAATVCVLVVAEGCRGEALVFGVVEREQVLAL